MLLIFLRRAKANSANSRNEEKCLVKRGRVCFFVFNCAYKSEKRKNVATPVTAVVECANSCRSKKLNNCPDFPYFSGAKKAAPTRSDHPLTLRNRIPLRQSSVPQPTQSASSQRTGGGASQRGRSTTTGVANRGGRQPASARRPMAEDQRARQSELIF